MSETDNPERAQERMKQRLADHAKWLETGEGKPADFSNEDLQKRDLRGTVLSKAIFRGANLARVLFFEAKLDGADFTDANIENGSLNNADAHGAIFDGANVDGIVLNETNLTGASFKNTILTNSDAIDTKFIQADLTDAKFDNSTIENVDMTNAILNGTDFTNSRLVGSILSKIKASKANFKDADLTDVDFLDVDLSESQGLSTELIKNSIIYKTTLLPKDLVAPDRRRATPEHKSTSDRHTTLDTLDTEIYARVIAQLVTSEHTRAPLTIGVLAPWGAGKSSVLSMVRHFLDGYAEYIDAIKESGRKATVMDRVKIMYRDVKDAIISLFGGRSVLERQQRIWPNKGKNDDIDGRITAWINVWKLQSNEQVWASIVHNIIRQVTERMSARQRDKFWFRLSAYRIDKQKIRLHVHKQLVTDISSVSALILVMLGATVLQFSQEWRPAFYATYIEWINGFLAAIGTRKVDDLGWYGAAISGSPVLLGGYLLKFRTALNGIMDDFIKNPNHAEKLGYLHVAETEMTHALEAIEATQEKPVVIFIDDLDRCPANKVAEIVTAINAFVANEEHKCIFVLGMFVFRPCRPLVPGLSPTYESA